MSNEAIKNRFTGSIIVEAGKYANVREAVEKSRANLSGANLSGADLYGADLSGANLSGANLYGANLYGANLYGANLYGADLSRANLYGADLSRANLSGANLYGADLYGADLSRANGEKLTLAKVNPILIIGPIGSRQSYLTAYNTDKGLYIKTGCFFDTIFNFRDAVIKTHRNTKHADDYISAIDFIITMIPGKKEG